MPQSCLTLCNPMSSSLPDFSVHRILQAKILEWVATSFSIGDTWWLPNSYPTINVLFFFLSWKTNEVHKLWPLSSVLKSVLSKIWVTSSRKINYSYCNKIAYFVCKIPEKKIFVLPHGMLLGSFSASINRNELPLILLHSHYRLVMGYSHCPSLLS